MSESSSSSSDLNMEHVPLFKPGEERRGFTKQRWERETYKKITKNKKDRVFFTKRQDRKFSLDEEENKSSSLIAEDVVNPFCVFKLIPYKKKNAKESSDSSSSSSSSSTGSLTDWSESMSSSFSSGGSSTDSQHIHLSTSSDSSSASSREDIQNDDIKQNNIIQEKIERKFKYPPKPLYLDDSYLGQGKKMHIIQLPSFRMSLLPYVSEE